MRPNGDILITNVTWVLLDRPDHVIVLFNRATESIGLKPIGAKIRNSLPVIPYGRSGGRVVQAAALVHQFRVRYKKTIRFHGAEIDPEGMLILELSTASQARVDDRTRALDRIH